MSNQIALLAAFCLCAREVRLRLTLMCTDLAFSSPLHANLFHWPFHFVDGNVLWGVPDPARQSRLPRSHICFFLRVLPSPFHSTASCQPSAQLTRSRRRTTSIPIPTRSSLRWMSSWTASPSSEVIVTDGTTGAAACDGSAGAGNTQATCAKAKYAWAPFYTSAQVNQVCRSRWIGQARRLIPCRSFHHALPTPLLPTISSINITLSKRSPGHVSTTKSIANSTHHHNVQSQCMSFVFGIPFVFVTTDASLPNLEDLLDLFQSTGLLPPSSSVH